MKQDLYHLLGKACAITKDTSEGGQKLITVNENQTGLESWKMNQVWIIKIVLDAPDWAYCCVFH